MTQQNPDAIITVTYTPGTPARVSVDQTEVQVPKNGWVRFACYPPVDLVIVSQYNAANTDPNNQGKGWVFKNNQQAIYIPKDANDNQRTFQVKEDRDGALTGTPGYKYAVVALGPDAQGNPGRGLATQDPTIIIKPN